MANAHARALRRTMTDAERRLWALLRRKQLSGFRFRRQHPVAPFILDFFCLGEKLAVELDGGQHFDDAARWPMTRGARRIWAARAFACCGFRTKRCSGTRTMWWRRSIGRWRGRRWTPLRGEGFL